MITDTQDYFVIQHKDTKRLWNGRQWITPQDRIDIYGCSLDPDSPEEDYSEYSLDIPDHPDDYEMTTIIVETRIIL